MAALLLSMFLTAAKISAECDPGQNAVVLLLGESRFMVKTDGSHFSAQWLNSTPATLSAAAQECGFPALPAADAALAGTSPPPLPGWSCAAANSDTWCLYEKNGGFKLMVGANAPRTFNPEDLVALMLENPAYPMDVLMVDATRFFNAVSSYEYKRALLLFLITHAKPVVRANAALLLFGQDTDEYAALQWVMAHDSDLTTRKAALASAITQARIAAVWDEWAKVALFIDDADIDLAWEARDFFLTRAPELAFFGASRDYKLDAISSLTSRMAREGEKAVRTAVHLLSIDNDAAVRAAARELLGNYEP